MKFLLSMTLIVAALLSNSTFAGEYAFTVVDTGQNAYYGDTVEITSPEPGEAYSGQDAQYDGIQPSYSLSGDGLTVYDNITGLAWQRSADGDGDIDVADKLT